MIDLRCVHQKLPGTGQPAGHSLQCERHTAENLDRPVYFKFKLTCRQVARTFLLWRGLSARIMNKLSGQPRSSRRARLAVRHPAGASRSQQPRPASGSCSHVSGTYPLIQIDTAVLAAEQARQVQLAMGPADRINGLKRAREPEDLAGQPQPPRTLLYSGRWQCCSSTGSRSRTG